MNTPYTLFGIECGRGWNKLIITLLIDLIKIGPIEVVQIKEKWGGLRFYASGVAPKQAELIRVAEHKSFTICERCGEPGKLRSDRSWLATLCDEANRATSPIPIIVKKKFVKTVRIGKEAIQCVQCADVLAIHGAKEYERFCKFMTGQTVPANPTPNGGSLAYRGDYDRWVCEGRQDRQLGEDWD